MRHYLARYTLRNGHQAQLDLIAASGCDAICQVLEQFADRVARISVRPA